MQPPDTLGYGVGAWRAAVRTLEAMAEEPENSRTALRVYGEAIDSAHRLRMEWERLGHPVLTTGSRGQVAAHPLLKAIRDAEAHALALASSLLLTPESRSRAARSRGGRPQGTSQSPDRQPTRLRRVR